MRSSTAEREKLLSGYSLLLIAALFAIAFAVLLPSKNQLSFNQSNDTELQNPDSISDLELAYLRARVASGEQSRAEVSDAVIRLIDAGMFEKAQILFSENPDVQLEKVDRFRLELEAAVSAYQQALISYNTDNSKASQTTKYVAALATPVVSTLHRLLDTPSLQNTDNLKRAIDISLLLNQGMITSSLYRSLAIADNTRSAHWFEQCGVYAMVENEKRRAAECYQQAVNSTNYPDKLFSLKIVMLRDLSEQESTVAPQMLIDELLEHNPVNAAQLEELSEVLLAVERPDAAVDTYLQLANIDDANEVKWLRLAARWAVASNQTKRAIELLSDIKPLVSETDALLLDREVENLLIAAGEQNAVLDRTDARIAANPEDKDSLAAGVALAQQIGNIQQALKWNTQLLAAEPNATSVVKRQITLQLAQGDLDNAKLSADRAVTLDPTDRESRIKLAQLSEWTGDPYAAVTHWLEVNQIAMDLASLDQLIRLADLTLQPAIAADALVQRTVFAEPNNDDLKKLVKLYELDGRPGAAAAAVENIINQYGATGVRYQVLADLHQRHSAYGPSLAAWQRHDIALTRTAKSLLSQIELHWRLSQLDSAAELSNELNGKALPAVASEYQVKLLAELAWRYDRPELAVLAGSRLQQFDNNNENVHIGRRLLHVMQDMGEYNTAVAEADRLWTDTGDEEFALSAMDIRFKRGDKQYPSNYQQTTPQTQLLHQTATYWNQMASMFLRNKRHDEAEAAYRQSLSIDGNNTDALSGLLWMYIGNRDDLKVSQILTHHQERAQSVPSLWSSFAVGFLQIGDVQKSLLWFARLGDRIDADYSLLLLFADALELAEQSEKAQRLRRYTLQKLRPLLADETARDHPALLRQYSRLLSQYGSAQEQEQLAQYLLSRDSESVDNADFWQEDIAIAWLMSTERHEHARVIMSRIHQRRLETPAWQQMALALKAKDTQALQSILELGGPVSAGNRIMALRTLGSDRQAQVLASRVNRNVSTLSARKLAFEQYASIRATRPSYAGSSVNSFSVAGLSINEVGVSARHTFSLSDVGVSVNYVQRYLDSSRFNLDTMDEQEDVAVSLYYADGRHGGHITTGFVTALDSDRVYVDGLYFRTSRDGQRRISGEVAYNEAAVNSTELRLAGKQNRATVGIDSSFGLNQFLRFQVDATELKTRISDRRIATGILARAEIGFRGSVGSHVWSTSVAADTRSNDRVDEVPSELMLSSETTMDSIIASEVTSLSVGASFARGEVNGTFPQTSAPRYYFNTRLGHSWPDSTYGLQLDAGAGIRLLGGDELSFGMSYEVLSARPVAGESDSTSFGVNYRYHF